jgi:hypothetical protein
VPGLSSEITFYSTTYYSEDNHKKLTLPLIQSSMVGELLVCVCVCVCVCVRERKRERESGFKAVRVLCCDVVVGSV